MRRRKLCTRIIHLQLFAYALSVYAMYLVMTSICYQQQSTSKNILYRNNEVLNGGRDIREEKLSDSRNDPPDVENKMVEEFKERDIGRRGNHLTRIQPTKIKPRKNKTRKPPQLDGPGEMGKGVSIDEASLSPADRKRWHDGWKKNSFNQYVSDMISVERSLPDYRFPECKNITYQDLPQVSVVIPFVNESFSTLVRTVHSILNRSPPHLLKEIVLCDDASKMDHLGDQLENYMADYEKVSIKRLQKRGGLINARILGFNHSTAPVVIFMDSHCEVTTGWLEPLLDRIKQDDRTVVSAVMDVISSQDFSYRGHRKGNWIAVGDLEWSLFFQWKNVMYKNPRTLPVKSATLVGCFIGISRRFFSEVGMFDPGFFIWGGENLEISFKAWMCGNGVEIVPCSHVGHVYKPSLPYSWEGKAGSLVIEGNLLRLAEVWLDDYKQFFYQIVGPERVSSIEAGDYSDRVALRKELGCKDFSWYLQNAIPDVFLPSECHAWGKIMNGGKQRLCVDVDDNENNVMKKTVTTKRCIKMMYYQLWYLCGKGFIRRKRTCLIPSKDGTHVTMEFCDRDKPELIWQYRRDNSIYNVHTKRCLQTGIDKQEVKLKKCTGSVNQRWQWTRGPPQGPQPSWRKHG